MSLLMWKQILTDSFDIYAVVLPGMPEKMVSGKNGFFDCKCCIQVEQFVSNIVLKGHSFVFLVVVLKNFIVVVDQCFDSNIFVAGLCDIRSHKFDNFRSSIRFHYGRYVYGIWVGL